MSIPAFTNEPGKHSRNGMSVRTIVGYDYDLHQPVNEYYARECMTDYCVKGDVMPSDHHSPTPWSRNVFSIIADDPCATREVRYSFGNLVYDATTRTQMSRYYDVTGFAHSDVFLNKLDNEKSHVLTQAREKLRTGRVQNGADIGQARQTAEQIAGSLSGLVNAYKAFKHGNIERGLSALGLKPRDLLSGKSLADKWLEVQYGWLPLMSSIYDNIGLLRTLATRKNHSMIMKVSSSSSATHQSKSSGLMQQYKTSFTEAGTVKVVYTYSVANWVIANLDTAGVVNPLSIAWELVPFSFVVDWFVPVGNVLESLSATLGLEFATGYLTTRIEGHIHYSLDGDIPDVNYTIVDPGNLTIGHFSMNRDLLASFALPELYANRNPFSTPHILNAIALTRQLI